MGLVWEVLTGCFLASFGCGRYGGHCANPKVAFNKTGSKIHSIRKRYSFSPPVSELTRNNIFLLFQIKLCGICCLASAVLCVVVTVTTTVIHMNRLQTLRECVYQGSIQTCTCFAGFFDPTMSHHDGNNNNWTFVGKNLRHLGKL